MRGFRKITLRIRSLLRGRRVEEELSDEIRFHLEKSIAANVAGGMTPPEARYAALRELGGPEQIKEECRDMRGMNLISSLLQDLHYGLRMLTKSWSFTIVAVLTLALGIGANTAIFSIANAVIWKPLPVPGIDRVVMVMEARQENPSGWIPASPANFFDWRAGSRSFESLAAYQYSSVNLVAAGAYTGQPQRLQAVAVTSAFFAALGAAPALGRTLSTDDERPGRNPAAILSHAMWQTLLNGDSRVLGKSIRLDGQEYQIAGVMPASFGFPDQTDLWVPLVLPPPLRLSRNAKMLFGIARLKPGVSLPQARAELAKIAQNLASSNPQTNTGWITDVFPFRDFLIGDLTSYMALLMGTVGFVLLIACVNVANLQLSRAISREREMAVRSSLGATRARLIRQLLVESVLLSLIGGALGTLASLWIVGLLRSSLDPSVAASIAGWNAISVDGRVLLFTLAACLAAGTISGLAPAYLSSRAQRNASLKAASGATLGRGPNLFRNVLIAGEVALALILLAGGALMEKGLTRLVRSGDRMGAGKLLSLRIALPDAKYGTEAEARRFFDAALAGIEGLPGVQSAALSNSLPYTGIGSLDFESCAAEGWPKQRADQSPACIVQAVSSNYLRTLRISLNGGRAIEFQDGSSAPPVAVLSARAAQQLWPDQDPIGRRLRIGSGGVGSPWLRVVGVATDIPQFTTDRQPRPVVYVSFDQFPRSSMQIAVRTAGDPLSLSGAIRSVIYGVDREQPVYEIATMQELINRELSGLQYVAALMAVFGGLALALAAIGVYGAMSYAVSQRTREIGLRMALGARRGSMVLLVAGRGVLLAATGVAAGTAVAPTLAQLISGMLFGVRPWDPLPFAAAAVALILVAAGAAIVPARRAMNVDPMAALRHE